MKNLFGSLFKNYHDSLFFLAGPCVIESEELNLSVALKLAEAKEKNSVTIVFKSSFDKANRTSINSYRGPGIDEGLKILQKIKKETGLPIVTDIHNPNEAEIVAEVADILQIPAFLCRQTDLLLAAKKTGKIINIKKGQFMAPYDMKTAIEKAGEKSMLTERGTFFGYNKLVVDFAGLHTMNSFGRPVVFDATHSVQTPSAVGTCSGGNRELALPLAKAAICQHVNGLFFEIHPNPDKALCDGPNSLKDDVFISEIPKLIALKRMISEKSDC